MTRSDDREFMQADDEMPGEDFSAMLERLGLTEDEYWEDRGWPDPPPTK